MIVCTFKDSKHETHVVLTNAYDYRTQPPPPPPSQQPQAPRVPPQVPMQIPQRALPPNSFQANAAAAAAAAAAANIPGSIRVSVFEIVSNHITRTSA